jgi:hypothetical protein
VKALREGGYRCRSCETRPLTIRDSRPIRAADLKSALVEAADMREGGYSAGIVKSWSAVRLRQVPIALRGVGSNANSIQTLPAQTMHLVIKFLLQLKCWKEKEGPPRLSHFAI